MKLDDFKRHDGRIPTETGGQGPMTGSQDATGRLRKATGEVGMNRAHFAEQWARWGNSMKFI